MTENLIQLRDNVSWSLVNEIKEICAPLFNFFNITYFDYARLYRDGRAVILYSNGHYVEYFLKDKAYYERPPTRIITEGFHLWNSYIDPGFIKKIASPKTFRYGNGVTIMCRSLDLI